MIRGQPPQGAEGAGWLARTVPGSIYGKLSFLAGAVIATAVAVGPGAFALLLLAAFTAALYRPGALLVVVRSPLTWLFTLSTLLFAGFFLRSTLPFVIQMLVKGIALLITFRAVTLSISMQEMLAATAPIMEGRFGFVLGVAFHSMHVLSQILEMSWATLRARHGGRTPRPAGLGRLVVTVITNGIRHADDVVLAAVSRGYDGGPRDWPRPRWIKTDFVYVGIPVIWLVVIHVVMVRISSIVS